jgi:alpha-ketoglutarate-dependent 2,4-dichlorophenoxyacetate dioxygenase
LHPVFAAEVTGIDLAEEITPEIVEYIEDAMAEFAVVVLPGQSHISDERHAEFSAYFGPREKPAGVASGDPKKRQRLGNFMFDAGNLDTDGTLLPPDHPRRKMRAGDGLWHTDSSFNPMPTKWSLLRAIEIPPEGGNTDFADCRAAYDALDEKMKAKIEDLAADHSIWTSRRRAGLEEITEEHTRGLPPVIQPVVRTIARSGRKALYIGAHAGHVYGMPYEEGKTLLEWLVGFATQPKFVYSHKWKVGEIVIWDNRAVLHRAGKFEGSTVYRRDMRRTTVDEFHPTWANLG